jgi:hypothetical protein
VADKVHAVVIAFTAVRSASAIASVRRGLRVRPGPALFQIGQLDERLRRRGDLQNRQRRVDRARELHAVLLANDDQAQPRPELAVGVGACRREQPGEIGAIEFDRREAVRLEVGGARTRIGPHHLVHVDADDVGGAAQANGNSRQRRVVDVEGDRDVGHRGLFRSERVGRGDRGGGALPYPRQETQIR